ncbi:MAG: tetratricopeptide repeat protein [Balneolaceae bacterium]
MNKEKWGKIEELVDQALTMPEGERKAFISKACQNNPDLKHEAINFLDFISESEGWLENSGDYQNAIFRKLSEDLSHIDSNTSSVGTKVGAYTIVKELAKGGMGTVYLAKRTDGVFEHQVAIKKINKENITQENIELFKQERNILADLNHPRIAHIYDGGITQNGIPYFVMEYIDGIPITDYCKENQLSLTQRLDLFAQILNAVQHAHENLVIHRDLKPANILVNADGQIKILDFGISKLISSKSLVDDLGRKRQVLTLKYASPEQLKNETITTATDFYSLGLILYQMLTLNLPYHLEGLTFYEAEDVIINNDPIPPSQNVSPYSSISHKDIKGELDAIILKSIHKNPDRRYRAASAFWDDLNRFKNNHPVSACEDTFLYRTKKLIARNKLGFASTIIILGLIISFSLFYTWQITDQKNQAQFEATKAEEISDFLIHLFEASDPANNLSNTFTTSELIGNSLAQIEKLNNQPLMQARLFDITGQVYRNIGLFDEAKEQINAAIQIREEHLGKNHPITLSSMHNLGLVLNDMGDYGEAASVFETVYEKRKELFGENNIEVASTQAFWAFSIRRQGDYDRAEDMARESLQIFRNQLGDSHAQTLDNINKLGITLHNKGKYEEAEELYVEVLNLRKQKLGEIHPQVAKSTNNLATLYLNTGRFNEAKELMEQALHIHKELYGRYHPNIAQVNNNLGLVHTELEQYEKADSLFLLALEMRNELLGPNHTNTAISIFSRANLMLDIQKPDSAITLFEKAYNIFSKELSPNHSFSAHSNLGIGRALSQKGLYEEAKPYYTKSIEQIRSIHDKKSIERTMAEYHFGIYNLNIGNYNIAQALIDSSFQALQDIEGQDGGRFKKVSKKLQKMTANESP